LASMQTSKEWNNDEGRVPEPVFSTPKESSYNVIVPTTTPAPFSQLSSDHHNAETELALLKAEKRHLEEKLLIARGQLANTYGGTMGANKNDGRSEGVFLEHALNSHQIICFHTYAKNSIWPKVKFVSDSALVKNSHILRDINKAMGFTTTEAQATYRKDIVKHLKSVLTQKRSYLVKNLRIVVVGEFQLLFCVWHGYYLF
jgi:hypothetical protein